MESRRRTKDSLGGSVDEFTNVNKNVNKNINLPKSNLYKPIMNKNFDIEKYREFLSGVNLGLSPSWKDECVYKRKLWRKVLCKYEEGKDVCNMAVTRTYDTETREIAILLLRLDFWSLLSTFLVEMSKDLANIEHFPNKTPKKIVKPPVIVETEPVNDVVDDIFGIEISKVTPKCVSVVDQEALYGKHLTFDEIIAEYKESKQREADLDDEQNAKLARKDLDIIKEGDEISPLATQLQELETQDADRKPLTRSQKRYLRRQERARQKAEARGKKQAKNEEDMTEKEKKQARREAVLQRQGEKKKLQRSYREQLNEVTLKRKHERKEKSVPQEMLPRDFKNASNMNTHKNQRKREKALRALRIQRNQIEKKPNSRQRRRNRRGPTTSDQRRSARRMAKFNTQKKEEDEKKRTQYERFVFEQTYGVEMTERKTHGTKAQQGFRKRSNGTQPRFERRMAQRIEPKLAERKQKRKKITAKERRRRRRAHLQPPSEEKEVFKTEAFYERKWVPNDHSSDETGEYKAPVVQDALTQDEFAFLIEGKTSDKKMQTILKRMRSYRKKSELIVEEMKHQEEEKEVTWATMQSIFGFDLSEYDDDLTVSRIAKWVTSFGTLVYQLYRSRNATDVIAAVVAFCNSFGDVTTMMMDFAMRIGKQICDCVISIAFPKTESLSGIVETLKQVMSSVVSSEALNSIRNLFLGLASMRLFSSNYAKNIFRYLGKPIGKTFADALYSVLEGLSTLFKFSDRLLAGESVRSILFAEDSIDGFFSEGNRLIRNQDNTYDGLPTEYGIDIRFYFRDLVQLLADAEEIEKSISRLDSRRSSFIVMKETLGKIYDQKLMEAKGKKRMAPIAIIVGGPPGMGKSHIVDYICRLQSMSRGREHQESFVHPRSKTSPYMEGYYPLSNPIIHYSEVGNYSLATVRAQGDPLLSEMQSMVDNLAFNVDMAFEDKGKVYASPEMVIADTNNLGLNAEIMYCPSALLRRFIFVEIAVKPEFRKEGSTSLDSQKSLADDSFLLERYTINLYVMKPMNNRTRKEYICNNVEWRDFTRVMMDIFIKHASNQEHVNERLSHEIITDYILDALDYEYKSEADIEISENKEPFQNLNIVDPDPGLDQEPFEQDEEEEPQLSLCTRIKDKVVGYLDYFKLEIFLITLTCLYSWLQISRRKGPLIRFSLRTFIEYLLMLPIAPTIILFVFLMWSFVDLSSFVHDILSLVSPTLVIKVGYLLGLTQKRHNYMVNLILKVKKPVQFFQNMDSSRKVVLITKSLAALLASIVIYKRINRPVTQSHTSFQMDDDSNEEINNIEEETGCNYGIRRVRLKCHTAWNTVRGVDPPVCTQTPEILERTIMRNVRKVRILERDKVPRKTMILGLRGNYALINTHALQNGDLLEMEVYPDLEERKGEGRTFVLQRDLIIDLGNDISIIRVDMLFRNIVKHFVSDTINSGQALIESKEIFFKYNGETTMTDDYLGPININAYRYFYSDHRPGLCGMPLIAGLGYGAVIIGVHSAGGDKSSLGARIIKNDIERGLMEIESLFPFNVKSGYLSEVKLDDPHPKSAFRYEELSHLDYFGKKPGSIILPSKSKLKKSAISDEMDMFFYNNFNFIPDEIYAPPVMRPRTQNGIYMSPINNLFRKMNNTPPTLEYNILIKVINTFSDRIISGLKALGVDKVAPLTLEEAINGVVGDDFTRRVNLSTSGGYNFPGGKRKYFKEVRENIYEMVPAMKEAYLQMLRNFSSEEFERTMVEIQFKDEARNIVKVRKAETRGYYMPQLDKLTLAKQYLSPFYTRMIEYGEVFCTAVGINLHAEADKFVHSLLDFSPFIMEGDYSGYDVANPVMIGYAASCIIYKVLESLGYNEHALEIVASILSDDLYPVMIFNKDVFSKSGLQPSGKYGTASDNSLRGCCMLMYAWYADPNTAEYDFFDYVKPIVYGDDLLAAVKPEVSSYFNNNTYQEACMRHFNMKFTNAAKTLDMNDFVSIETMSFLKRTFRVHSNGLYVAQLSLNSIYKSLYWTLPSNHITWTEQLKATVISTLWELFFHCDDECEYNEYRNQLIDIVMRNVNGDITEDTPTYGYIYNSVFPSQEVLVDEIKGDDFTTEADLEDREELFPYGIEMPCLNNRLNTTPTTGRNCVDSSCINRRADNKENVNEDIYDVIPTQYVRQVPPLWNEDRAGSEYLSWMEARLEVLLLEGQPELDVDKYATVPFYRRMRKKDLQLQLEYERCVEIDELRQSILSMRRKLRKETYFTEAEREEKQDVTASRDEVFQSIEMNQPTARVGETLVPDVGSSTQFPLADFFKRPIIADTFDIDDGDSFFQEYDVWDLWSLNQPVRNKLKNFAGFKGDLCVHVAFSASAFHKICCGGAYIPYATRNTNLQNKLTYPSLIELTRNQLSSVDGARAFFCNENNVHEWKIPFISHKGGFRLFNNSALALGSATQLLDFKDAGSFFLWSYEPLRVSQGTQGIRFTVYITAENVELLYPTNTQMVFNTESEPQKGPVEEIISHNTKVLHDLADMPVIGKYAHATGQVLDGIGEAATTLGWSKPILDESPMFVKNEPFRNGANAIDHETSKRLTWDPLQELSVDPRLGGIMDDELVFRRFYERSTYLTKFYIDAVDTPGTVKFRCLVDPMLHTKGGIAQRSMYQPLPMAFVANFFKYWCGTLVFTFVPIATRYDRVKLQISTEPNTAQYPLISGGTDLNKRHVSMFNIDSTSAFQYKVHWQNTRPWLQVRPLSSLDNMYSGDFGTTLTTENFSNGYIEVSNFTSLANNDGSSVAVLVFVNGEDMHFNFADESELPTERFYTETEYNMFVEENDLNPTYRDYSNITQYNFGEEVNTFRMLFRRMITMDGKIVSAGVGDHARVDIDILTKMVPNFTTTGSFKHPIQYVRPCFLYARGGLRYRLSTTNPKALGPMEMAHVSYIGPESKDNGNSVAYETYIGTNDLKGTLNFIPFINGIEFEAANYNSNFAYYACEDSTTNDNGNEYAISIPRRVSVHLPADTTVSATYHIHMSGAEDFTFMRFVGVPHFTTPI